MSPYSIPAFVLAIVTLAAPAGRDSTSPRAGSAPVAAAHASVFPEYQRLLDDYLVVISDPGAPLETRFNYIQLAADPGRFERFDRIRDQLLEKPPSRMSGRARLAWAINTYNYLVIETLTNNLYDRPIKGISKGMRTYVRRIFTSVNQITLPGGSFFEAPVIEVEGVKYSLNAFERHFVFADYDRSSKKPRPALLDPRAHFALVCAAQGCPALMPRAYTPDSLDQELDRATRTALASPRHLKWDAASGQLSASSIFDWYAADFGGADQAFAFLKRYAPPAVGADLEAKHVTGIASTIPWEWKLNQVIVKGS